MRKLLILIPVFVVTVASIQLAEPVKATGGCNTQEWTWCNQACESDDVSSCPLVNVSCDFDGSHITCGCDYICPVSPHGGIGGPRHFELSPEFLP